MKKFYLLFLVVAVLTGCDNKVENAIKDYEQTMGSTKIDLSMKIKSLKKIGEYTGADSLSAIGGEGLTTEDIQQRIDETNQLMAENKEKYRLYSDSLEMEMNNANSKTYRINYYKGMAEVYEEMANSDSYDKMLSLYDKALYYAGNPQKVLGNIWECTYTIENPVLNAKQEITKQYLFNVDDTEIIDTLDDEDDDE